MTWDLTKPNNTGAPVSTETSEWKTIEIAPIRDILLEFYDVLELYGEHLTSFQEVLSNIQKLSTEGNLSLKTFFPKGFYNLVFIEPSQLDTLMSKDLQKYTGEITQTNEIDTTIINKSLDSFKNIFNSTT